MNIFHVHSYRCGHAEQISDEAYVKKAIELGADDIWFTDHAPFPNDPFGSRMHSEKLEEYLGTLSALKRKYTEINIHIGLETEYFPHFDNLGYYKHLRSLPEIEILLLGQHMAQISDSPAAYSFSKDSEYLDSNEYKLLGNAIIQGAATGYFGAVAHPDRIFRRCSEWNKDMENVSKNIIQAAVQADIPLEMNLSSAESPIYYKNEFWQFFPDSAKRIIGFDAHYIDEMAMRYENSASLLKVFEKKL